VTELNTTYWAEPDFHVMCPSCGIHVKHCGTVHWAKCPKCEYNWDWQHHQEFQKTGDGKKPEIEELLEYFVQPLRPVKITALCPNCSNGVLETENLAEKVTTPDRGG